MDKPPPMVRDYRNTDLGRVVRLWDDLGMIPDGPDGFSVDEATDLIASDDSEVIVAEHEGEIVGMGLGSVSGIVGFLFRIVGDTAACGRLIEELEGRLVERGARTLVAAWRESDDLLPHLSDRGYARDSERVVLVRNVPATTARPAAVTELGGELVDRRLWDRLVGLEDVKSLIYMRIVMPLAQPEMAAYYGVSPAKAVVLFGPPGTGKTSFAKAVAARLEWPFIPIEAGQLAAEGSEQEARLLSETFDQLLDLPSAVAFVDEVEDIAGDREDRKVSQRVTTEFLRQIPRLREAPHHLLIVATNLVSRLDDAFLRPGRFDYILPIGPPDDRARRAIWSRYVEEITDEDVDLSELVEASDRFTPADIEFASRKAAQIAFERKLYQDISKRATTDDFLEAIQQTRPTLTKEMIESFEADAEEHSRQ